MVVRIVSRICRNDISGLETRLIQDGSGEADRHGNHASHGRPRCRRLPRRDTCRREEADAGK